MTDKLHCSAVVFDFDGTLADSMPFLEMIGVQVMMKYYGVPEDDATHRYRSTTGLPYEHQIENNFPRNSNNHQAVEEFEQLKIDRIFEQKLFPDTTETLRRLKELGLDIFVSSSTFQPTIIKYFEQRGLVDFFREILGYRPGFEKGKHHFDHIQAHHNLALADVVFVGDSLKDYERSKGICQFIGIRGIFTEEDFRKAGHTGHIVDSIGDVPDLLEPI
ncbi:MAG: HAD family hydrolase [Candidatus Thorarchaeota archaeon]